MLHYFSSISSLLVFILCQLQVNALLKETTIAIDTGHKLMSVLEKRDTYTDVENLIDDLKHLTKIYCKYMVQREQTLYASPINNDFMNLEQLLLDDNGIIFFNVCGMEEYIFNEAVLANTPADSTIDEFTFEILRKNSIHENDYDLKGEMVWGDALNKMHKLITTARADSGQSPLDLLTNETEVNFDFKNLNIFDNYVTIIFFIRFPLISTSWYCN